LGRRPKKKKKSSQENAFPMEIVTEKKIRDRKYSKGPRIRTFRRIRRGRGNPDQYQLGPNENGRKCEQNPPQVSTGGGGTPGLEVLNIVAPEHEEVTKTNYKGKNEGGNGEIKFLGGPRIGCGKGVLELTGVLEDHH